MSQRAAVRKIFKSGVTIRVEDLCEGMFVSEIDSGWEGTPFLMQGMLLQSNDEIVTIKGLAKHVTVDPGRSKPHSIQAFDDADLFESETEFSLGQTSISAIRALPSLLDYQQRIDLRDGERATRWQRLAVWWQQLSFQMLAKSGKLPGSRRPKPVAARRRPAYIPEEFPLVVYAQPEPTNLSISTALNACDAAENVLQQLIEDLSAQRTIDIADVKLASDTLADNMISRPSTMLWAAKMREKSDRLYNHGLGVAIYLTALGRQLGFQREQMADLANIGLLLDLGKLQMDRALFDKPAKLDAHEIDAIQLHVQHGLEMLSDGGLTAPLVMRAIAEHHERIDGAGYPAGINGEDITIFGKMAAIADAYTAMINPRPYAPAYTPHDAMRLLFAEVDSRWYGPLVEQFVQSIGIFPVGSLIELSTGEVAIVVQHNQYRRLEPLVLILTDANKQELRMPHELDMLKYNFAHAPNVVRIVAGLPDGAFGITMKDYYL